MSAFKFFASVERTFSDQKSLLENFTHMCAFKINNFMDRMKKDSPKTIELKKTIADCNFNAKDTKDIHIAKLQVLKWAVDDWLNERKNVSSRWPKVEAYRKSINQYQKDLLKVKHQEDLNTNGMFINPLNNPLIDLKDLLPNSLWHTFDRLNPAKHERVLVTTSI